ncbi:hypothetical protein [Tsukamurella hominis]|uniref:hypothetical protein n=1 Tax=Tsukamurella hominis TaxID=1970232 RepID=UPI0039E9A1F6
MLTEAEVRRYRAIVDYTPSRDRDVPHRREPHRPSVELRQRIRGWFAAEDVDPLQPLPYGVTESCCRDLQIDRDRFRRNLLAIRRAEGVRVRRGPGPCAGAADHEVRAMEWLTAHRVDFNERLPRGTLAAVADAAGCTLWQAKAAISRLRAAS